MCYQYKYQLVYELKPSLISQLFYNNLRSISSHDEIEFFMHDLTIREYYRWNSKVSIHILILGRLSLKFENRFKNDLTIDKLLI